ncbi:hypothetical protein FQR65_LT09054 [Abscondita terminalis]|nr:hypothetical protein FQR65_LT09054 [Abscondita terminalis]
MNWPKYKFSKESEPELLEFLKVAHKQNKAARLSPECRKLWEQLLPLDDDVLEKIANIQSSEIECIDITESDEENDQSKIEKELLETEQTVSEDVLKKICNECSSKQLEDMFVTLSMELNSECIALLLESISMCTCCRERDLVATYFSKYILLSKIINHDVLADQLLNVLLTIIPDAVITDVVQILNENEDVKQLITIRKHLKSLKDDHKSQILAQYLKTCTGMEEKRVANILPLITKHADPSVLSAIVTIMYNSAKEFTDEKSFGKLIMEILQVLESNVIKFESQLNVFGANILHISPIPTHSHHIWNKALAYGLNKKGHNITMLTHNEEKSKPKNVHLIVLEGMYDKEFETFSIDSLLESNPLVGIKMLYEFSKFVCEHDLASNGLTTLMNYPKDFKFDLIVFDVTYVQCLYPIIDRFNNPPVVGVTPFLLPPVYSHVFGNPLESAYMPIYSTIFTDRMNFKERLINFFLIYAEVIYRQYIAMPEEYALAKKYFGENTRSLIDIERNISILLANTDPNMEYPLDLPPNIIPVGGLQVQPAKSLPEDLQQIINNAKNGVVVFSLGSYLRSDRMSTSKRTTILNALAKLPQTVIWKFESHDLTDLPKNVIIRKWLPQSDLVEMNKKKSETNWCVVQFKEDKSVEAVPTTWVVNNNCHWPPFTKAKLSTALQAGELPDDTWNIYPVHVFRNSVCGDYLTARKKTERATITSDLESTSENEDGRKKRKIVVKRFSSFSSAEEYDSDRVADTKFAEPPQLKRKMNISTLTQTILKDLTDDNREDDIQLRCLPSPAELTNELSLSKDVQSNQPAPPMGLSDAKLDKLIDLTTKIIKQQTIIKGMVSGVMEELANVKLKLDKIPNTPDLAGESIYTLCNLPIDSDEDMNTFEDILKDEEIFKKAVKEISSLGGSSSYDFGSRSLKRIITNKYAGTYSLLGRKGKKKFIVLKSAELIINAGMVLNYDRKSMEVNIQKWLKRATERGKHEN